MAYADTDADAYQASVESFHQVLIDVMQISDQASREEALLASITTLFDITRIASISLGRTWRSMPDEQQEAFTALLSELIVATYADRFDRYNQQHFETHSVTPVKSGFVVQTYLHRPDGDAVTLDYFMRDGRVFNVVADGVSDLSLRRADYNSIVKTQGYEALVAHMRDKITIARDQQ